MNLALVFKSLNTQVINVIWLYFINIFSAEFLASKFPKVKNHNTNNNILNGNRSFIFHIFSNYSHITFLHLLQQYYSPITDRYPFKQVHKQISHKPQATSYIPRHQVSSPVYISLVSLTYIFFCNSKLRSCVFRKPQRLFISFKNLRFRRFMRFCLIF